MLGRNVIYPELLDSLLLLYHWVHLPDSVRETLLGGCYVAGGLGFGLSEIDTLSSHYLLCDNKALWQTAKRGLQGVEGRKNSRRRGGPFSAQLPKEENADVPGKLVRLKVHPGHGNLTLRGYLLRTFSQ